MPSRIVCFVCGSLGGEFQLHSRPNEGRAFFPFLEHHDPPKGSRIPGSDGVVDSCRVCYAFLTQQWDTYERTNTPAIKRLYWLKRLDDGQFTGAEMKLQGEYMAQVMGLQYQPSCGDSCAPLSPDSRDGFTSGNRELDYSMSRKQDCDEGVLDLSVPIKSEVNNKSKVKPNQEVVHHRPEVSSSRSSLDELGFICYTCGAESQGVAAKFISSNRHATNKPYFPFLMKVSPPKGAAPLNEQGICQVCDHCFSSLCHQWLSYEHQGTPNSARIFKVNDIFFSNDASLIAGLGKEVKASSKDFCYLCGQTCSSSKMCPLYTAPLSGKKDHMYFPFIRELRRPHGARPLNPDGSVQVCISCFSNLQLQWHRYETERVPFLHRRYSLLPPTTASGLASLEVDLQPKPEDITSRQAPISLVKETSKSPSLAKTSHATYVQSGQLSSASATSGHDSNKNYSGESKSSASVLSIPHPLQQAGERPKKVCFLCGEKCLITKTQLLYSYPVRQDAKSFGGQSHAVPFFPFLASHEPAPGAEPMNDDGVVISCSYCFYSLLNQWRDYEESRGNTESSRWQRKYKLNDFVCFVCGMMVPRKKLRTLEVQKFQFLREHKAPPHALVMWGGQAVGACGSCHFSLTHQYTEFERLGLPLELRKYNWTVQHHNEDNSDTQSSGLNHDINVSNAIEENVTDANEDSIPGPVSNRLTLNITSSSSGKLPITAIMPSSSHISPNSVPGSSCLSSFSAALRKLAHQTKDPNEETSVKHSRSPPSHSSSRSTTPKRAHGPLVFPSKVNVLTPGGSYTPSQGQTDTKQSFERSLASSNTSPLEHQLRLDSRDGSRGRDSQMSNLYSRVSEMYARDYHNYRSEEEAAHHGLTVPLRIDPAAYMAAASYHPFLIQQQAVFGQAPFRLDDPMLLEQYRMLQSTFMPFSGAGFLPQHVRGVDVHTMLAAAAASQQYPIELLQQHYPYLSPSHPFLNPRFAAQSALMERAFLEEENLRQKSKEQERLLEWEIKSEPPLSVEREYKHDVVEQLTDKRYKEKHKPETLGIATAISEKSPQLLNQLGVSHMNNPFLASPAPLHPLQYDGLKLGSKVSTRDGYLERSLPPSLSLLQSLSQPHLSSLEEYAKSHSIKISESGNKLNVSHSPPKMAKLSSHSSYAFSQHSTSHHQDKASTLSPQPATTPTHGSLHLPQMLSPSYQPSPLSNNRKVRCSSESKALFRPFDDKETSKSSTGEIKSDDHVNRSSSNIYLGSLLSNTSTHTPQPAILSIPSIKVSSHISNSQAAIEKQPPLSITSDSKIVDPISSYVRNKVERFDFKSLARECTSASVSETTTAGESQSSGNETATADDKQAQFLSKLDHEAKRRSKRKLKSDADSDNEMDVEDRMMIRLTMIGRVTPIPLDVCPEKMEVLEYLGVTTWENKNELLRQKEIRRRRQLGLSSVSPIQYNHEAAFESSDSEALCKRFTPCSQLHFDYSKLQLLKEDAPPQEKSKFLSDLGLLPSSSEVTLGFGNAYKWPGIDVVMKSYEKYREEQIHEANLLRGRCHELQADNENLEQTSQSLNRHMAVSFLLAERQRLDEERKKFKEKIGSLKKNCQDLM
ncbi:uncharacterized protein LOC131957349 isoform X3 [Physella acuta]|uniref:uncharacterized protein LOC131957349 isoform X3 n=1 Tax=Physella acuta TaxID=109671 RepID=UPI0027DB760D|nr:uncharacterized protein LOC131957349 isoform X3 [Physella acuta]